MQTPETIWAPIRLGILVLAPIFLLNGCQKSSTPLPVTTSASVLDMEPIPRTPERVARGKYLVEGLTQCWMCYSEVDYTQRPIQPVAGKKNGGYIFPNVGLELPEPNRVVASNISPDAEF